MLLWKFLEYYQKVGQRLFWLVSLQRSRGQWPWLCFHFAPASHMLHSSTFLLIYKKLHKNIFEIGGHVCFVRLQQHRRNWKSLKRCCILCCNRSPIRNFVLVSSSNFVFVAKMFKQKQFSSLVSHTRREVLTALDKVSWMPPSVLFQEGQAVTEMVVFFPSTQFSKALIKNWNTGTSLIGSTDTKFGWTSNAVMSFWCCKIFTISLEGPYLVARVSEACLG